jgi:hypothetical protein
MVRDCLKGMLALGFLLLPTLVPAQQAVQSLPGSNPDWTTPHAPFRIASNLHYVGSKDLASYLIVTAAGNMDRKAPKRAGVQTGSSISHSVLGIHRNRHEFRLSKT